MKHIPLIGKNGFGKSVLCDNRDYALLSDYIWYGSEEGSDEVYAATCFYDKATKKTRVIKMARLLMNPGPTQEVDHKDGNSLNNCRSNLRLCTHVQNMRNKRKQRTRNGVSTKSRFKGVSFQHGKWIAYVSINNKQIYLGRFVSELEAARAYNNAALIYYREFAKLNETGTT